MSSESVIVSARPGKRMRIDPNAARPFERFFAPDQTRWWRDGKMPLRDASRQKCYDAESEFRRQLVTTRRFIDIPDAAQYLQSFLEKAWFQRRFPLFQSVELNLVRGGTCHAAPCQTIRHIKGSEVVKGTISMSKWGLGIDTRKGVGGESVLLHELAHAVLPAGHGHDRRWARVFLEFVGCGMGQDAKAILMECYNRHGVKYSPYKQAQVTNEQIARLAACRPNNKGGKAK